MTTKRSKNRDAAKFLEKITGKKLTLGSLLCAIRQGDELSQADFAETLGISKQYLCDIERGRRFVSPKAADEYANKLGYSPNQFIRLCLQDLLDREGIRVIVDIKAA